MADTIYCYPGTDVLMNKLDIHDAELLQSAERDLPTTIGLLPFSNCRHHL